MRAAKRVGSCGALHQIADPSQVEFGTHAGEELASPPYHTEFDFARHPDRLQPPRDLFDLFAFLLTGSVEWMSRGLVVNCTGMVRCVLGHMGHDLQLPQIERAGVRHHSYRLHPSVIRRVAGRESSKPTAVSQSAVFQKQVPIIANREADSDGGYHCSQGLRRIPEISVEPGRTLKSNVRCISLGRRVK